MKSAMSASLKRSTAQTRRLLEELSVVDANGRGLFYRFSTSTTDADPGAGYIRLNNADLTLATAAYIDVTDANGGSVAGEIDTWDDSTSLAKGKLWVRGIAQPAAFHSYEVTGSVVDGTGYRKLTLTHVGGSGSFAADDELMVAFARTGDIGEGYITNATVADPTELTALEGETAGYLVFVTICKPISALSPVGLGWWSSSPVLIGNWWRSTPGRRATKVIRAFRAFRASVASTGRATIARARPMSKTTACSTTDRPGGRLAPPPAMPRRPPHHEQRLVAVAGSEGDRWRRDGCVAVWRHRYIS